MIRRRRSKVGVAKLGLACALAMGVVAAWVGSGAAQPVESSSGAAPFATFRWMWGHFGSGLAQYRNPTDIAVYRSRADMVNLIISDSGNARFTVMTDRGAFIEKWGEPGGGPRQFSAPWGVALDRGGDAWIADTGNKRIQRVSAWTNGLHDPAGVFRGAIGKPGANAGELEAPTDVALDAAGNLYVVDRGNHRVQKLGPQGEPLAAWGGLGTEPGQFQDPLAIAIAADGSVYVTDYRNERVQKFDGTGKLLGSWGEAGTGPGQFSGPAGVAVDGSGRVYVVDRGNSRVQVFAADGSYIGSFGSEGTGKGQFLRPSGMTVDDVGKIYVVDTGNHRVQVFMPS